MTSDDASAIRRATDELGTTLQKLGASMYQQPGAAGPEGGPETPPPPAGGDQPGGENVVDGEFRNA